MKQAIKEKVFGKRLTPARVAILGMLLALLIAFKYILGFVPGVEIVSFLIIFFALFLPLVDLLILVVSFNLLVLALYGFGAWWIAYWPIFMFDALISFSLRKISKHRFFFAFLCFLGGASVGFWYFLSNIIIFDSHYAILNVITSVPINLVEGFTSMFMAIVFGPALVKVFNQYSHKFWSDKQHFSFVPVKFPTIAMFSSVTLAFASIGGATTLLLNNQFFTNIRSNLQGSGHSIPPGTARPASLLKTQDYNYIYNHLQQGDAAIVVIANHKHWTYYAHGSEHQHAQKYISNNTFYISYWKDLLGSVLRQVFDSKTNQQISPRPNPGETLDPSPFIYVDNESSQSGISGIILKSRSIIEITYDHNQGEQSIPSKNSSHVYVLNKPGDHTNFSAEEVTIPLVSTLSGLALLLLIIWSPNIYYFIKKRLFKKH